MLECTKIIEFVAAHRIPQHRGKCRNLHGHQYRAEITFSRSTLDDCGMVVDFGIIKERLGSWIMENWDHNVILQTSDQQLGSNIAIITGQRIYYLLQPPTAEAMAAHLLREIVPQLFADLLEADGGGNSNAATVKLFCRKIRLYETPTSYAEVASPMPAAVACSDSSGQNEQNEQARHA